MDREEAIRMDKFFEFLKNNTEDAGNWSIECSQHKSYYETAKQVIEEWEADKNVGPCLDFETPAHRQRAIDTNTIFYLQWYRRTPVSFDSYAAPTMEELASWVMSDQEAISEA